MGEREIGTFILSLVLTVMLVVMAVLLIIISIRRRQLFYAKEKQNAELQHQQQLLEARQDLQQSLMQHLGAELHDTIGQKLTLAYLQMQNTRYLDDISKVKEQVEAQSDLIQDSLNELRSLSKILISHDFSDFGFIHFLEKEMDRLAQSGLCKAIFIAPRYLYKPSNERVELTLARICQEFIQNSLKHSGCSTIKIEVQFFDKQLHIRCSDDGNGIDRTKINMYDVKSGSGLPMINNRASSIGAHCEWKNENGTSLSIKVPLDKITGHEK